MTKIDSRLVDWHAHLQARLIASCHCHSHIMTHIDLIFFRVCVFLSHFFKFRAFFVPNKSICWLSKALFSCGIYANFSTPMTFSPFILLKLKNNALISKMMINRFHGVTTTNNKHDIAHRNTVQRSIIPVIFQW